MALEYLIGAAIFLYTIYKLGTWDYNKWQKVGIPSIKPWPFVGTRGPVVLGKQSLMELDKANYFHFKSLGCKVGGIYDFLKPSLLVLDPDIIKNIMIKDFDVFTNHRDFFGNTDFLFSKNLFALRDQQWKDMRNVLSPAFTTSKIRQMFDFIDKCGKQLVDFVKNKSQAQIRQGHPDKDMVNLELKDTFTLFTNDVIASTAFGIEVDSLKDRNNQFYLMGKDLTNFAGIRFFKFFMGALLSKFITLQLIPKELGSYFHNLIHDTIKTREEKNIVRPDMIHLLMQARKGTLNDEEETNLGVNNKGKLPELTDEDITAQATVFFIAGFDTVSTFLSFAVYALALNPDAQQKLLDEIEAIIKSDGKLTYEGVMNKMAYLDMVTNETNRLFPGGGSLEREATRRYIIPASHKHPEIVLEKNDVVFIPLVGLHADPEYFPNPTKFDPERFSPERKASIPANVFMPFGAGPRNCIGMRFALLESKICLIHLVRNFLFEVVPKTEIPLKMKPNSFTPMTKNGIWIGLRPRS